MINQKTLLQKMLRIRMIEQRIAERYKEQNMRCPVHLSIGQEAAAVGVAEALSPQDKMVSTHRGHAHYLAKGGSLEAMLSELYGKSTGCSLGNGGSMHLIDLNRGFYGSTSIVGGTIPVGVGLSFADRIKKDDSITIVCIGDAAVEEGVFHEAANFSSLHKLKVIFVCENNLYSCFTHISKRQPDRPLRYIARAHNLNYVLCQPNDVEDIYLRSLDAIKLTHTTGPVFMEIPTYRLIEHCGPDTDDHLGYRNEQELQYWIKHDPLKNPEALGLNEEVIRDEIEFAFLKAAQAPYPQKSEIGKYVFKNSHV